MKHVVITGGGTAGWMTANLMDALLNGPTRRTVSLTLIESPAIGRIGVGEATIPSLRRFLADVGLEERDFMRRTDATFKHGIGFRDWAFPGNAYFHQFDAFRSVESNDAFSYWLGQRRTGAPKAFHDCIGVQAAVAAAGLAPKSIEPGPQRPLNYAYHLDAEAFARLLTDCGVRRGVQHIEDEVAMVDRDPVSGRILSIRTVGGLTMEGDLFVDCSGFQSLLLHRAAGEPRVDYGRHLLCNAAVAIQVPNREGDPIAPYTKSTAQQAGWIWDIALQTRRGVGYVYSDAFIDADVAEAALRAHIGDAARSLSARRLTFRTERLERSWVSNCIAIGLSSGFIEPLESTGIALIDLAVRSLCELFPFGDLHEADISRFNAIMARHYDEIRDFIVLHYCLSRRDDTAFWRAVNSPEHIPDSLQESLRAWQRRPPVNADFGLAGSVFQAGNYRTILFGMDVAPLAKGAEPECRVSFRDFESGLLREREAMLRSLPRHEEWLGSLARERAGPELRAAWPLGPSPFLTPGH